MSEMMKGSNLLLPGLAPPVQIFPQQQAPYLSSASTSRSTTLPSHFQSCRRFRQYSSYSIRRQRQQVLCLDSEFLRVKHFSSSFHGDGRALKQQRPWSKEKFKNALNSYRIRGPKRIVDVQSFSSPFDESHRPRRNKPPLATSLPSALEANLPSTNVDPKKARDVNAPRNLDRSTPPSTPDAVPPGSKGSSKPVPTVSTISERRITRRAEESTAYQRAPSPVNERPGPRVERSYMVGNQPRPTRSSNRVPSSNSGGVARYGSRDGSRDAAQGNASIHMHRGGTTSQAIAVLQNRLQQGITTDSDTYVEVLQTCLKQKDLFAAKQVHDCIIQSGMDKKRYVARTLLNVYIKCGALVEARRVFDQLGKKSVVEWTNLITGYAKSAHAESALELFNQMRQEAVEPNEITYLSILKACAGPLALKWGKEIHECIRHAGFESDVRVGTALLKMYANCGCIMEARQVFENLANRDVITWTEMIGGLARHGCGQEAYRLFCQMRREGVEPNAFTYASILNASASAAALEWVKEVHGHARKAGLESDMRVGTALVHIYVESGTIDDAREVFDRMERRDVVTWTTMIGGLAQHGCGHEAYRLFCQMRREGVEPDAFTYTSILNAFASAGALEWVKEVHCHASKAGLESDLRVGNALVHMYAKSGSLDDARQVFVRMTKRDLVTWTKMIGGLAEHGCGHEALDLFRKMNEDGVKPDGTSFVAVLSACCHAGLLDDGRRLFSAMTQEYGIEPTVVHYTCMVDLLGRAGHLEEAMLFISDMPVETDGVTWSALLGACRTHSNVELGELAAKELFKLEPKDSSAYVLLSNIYAAAGKWDKVSAVRAMMDKIGVRKEAGRSLIEIDNKIHEFVAGDTSHPEAKAIYTYISKLTEELKAEGYIPDTELVLQSMDEEDKELALCSHSERLAIAYGLMHIPWGKPIRVQKNLRVCSDCHTATKLISKVTGREIIARDAVRFHHFKDGMCSCGDYW
ncbi:unnamed protein product [Calypogeia fissa]